jgi:WD40 repeat protein/tetratricopeptide (TPR) repeat protein
MSEIHSTPPPADSTFEQVLAEFLQAEEQGLRPDPQRYLDSFPAVAEQLRAFFADRLWFGNEAPHLAPTPPPAAVLTPETESGRAPAPAGRFAGYEIVGELGRGGMGVVYKARQLEPERLVALKVIRTDRLEALSADERRQWIDRFHREARLVAALDQPAHIVTLHEVGEHQGQPYFTMRLVEGGSLAGRLRGAGADQRVRGQRANARLLAQVARAVDFAHRRGVLHRDLKPGNILLDADGQPLVTDFGLARRLDETGSLVASGIEGTAAYMPPEQAAASRAAMTTAADVYSLGAILYEMLTGQPPFRGQNDVETLLQVLNQEPVPPRQRERRLSRDLETICLKCLHKEPGRRYRSAAALAEDLENWLAGRPIAARPVGPAGRLWRWCRRNPVPATAAAVVLVTAVVAFAWVTASRNAALKLADDNGRLAGDNGNLAETNGALARTNGQLAEERGKLAAEKDLEAKRAQREATNLAFEQAMTLCDGGEVAAGMHLLVHGLDLAEQARAPDLEHLFRANLAAWRQHLHTQRAVLPHAGGVSAVACSPDGRTWATATWDRATRLRFWDAATGQPRGAAIQHEPWITGLAFSPDGKTLLAVEYDRVGIWDVASGKRVGELAGQAPRGQGALVSSVVFSPDGRTALTGGNDGNARLWDLAKRQMLGGPAFHGDWVSAVAFSPDGRFFFTGGKQRGLLAWDPAGPRQPAGGIAYPGGVTGLAVSPDGRLLLIGGANRTAQLWDLATNRPRGEPFRHRGEVKAVAFSPDGSLAATASLDRTARLWDVATGQPLGQPLLHPGEVLAVAFAADGRTVLTGQGRTEGDARAWDLALGNPAGGDLGHNGSVLAVAFSPDGKRVATAGRDNAARLWDAATAEPVGDALPHNGEINAVVFSPDSRVLVSAGEDSVALFWEAATGKPVVRVARPVGDLRRSFQLGVSGRSSGFDLGGSSRDMLGRHGREPIWGPDRGRSEGRRGNQGAAVYALAFSKDGKKLVTAGRDGEAIVWDMQRGAFVPAMHLKERKRIEVYQPDRNVAAVYAVAFSPDDRLVAVGADDGTVRLWDVTHFDPDGFIRRARENQADVPRLWDEATKPRPAAGPLKHDGPVVALAFSPDGKALLTGSGDGTARLWEVSGGKPLLRPLPHGGPVVGVAFRPDGRRCVTASWDGGARLWDPATGELVGQPLAHQGKVLAAAFSPDGHTLVTAGEDGTARLWDVDTARPVGPPLRHQDEVRAAAFGPDSRAVVTASEDRTARLWRLPAPAAGTADQLRSWVEVWTGLRRAPDGTLHHLDRTRWEAARARLAEREKPPVEPEDRLGWHRRQARAAEATGRWDAARWHLDRLVEAGPRNAGYLLRRGKVLLRMDNAVKAREDFGRAAEVAPQGWEAWFLRGQAAVRLGEWQHGIDDLSRALERLPKEEVLLMGYQHSPRVPILQARGYARAGLGRWKEAAEDLGQVAHNPFQEITPEPVAHFALVLLRQGDGKGHAAACRDMLARFAGDLQEPKSTVVTGEFGRQEVYSFGKSFDARTLTLMAWVCSLAPDAVADRNRPVQLARRAAAAETPRPEEGYPAARALGAALYRAGQWEEAVKQLDDARAMRPQPSPSVWLFLAMAHEKAGRRKQAQEWLNRARAWIEQAHKPKPEGAAATDWVAWEALPWTERVALEVLEREAGKLIPPGTSK